MSTGPVHLVAHFTVHDPVAYRSYEQGIFPTLKAHGGRFVTYDDHPTVLEGSHAPGRTVIVEFDSEDACLAWWSSPEYAEIARHRRAATTSHSIVIVHTPARGATGHGR